MGGFEIMFWHKNLSIKEFLSSLLVKSCLVAMMLSIVSCSAFEKNVLRKRPIYEAGFTEVGSPEFHYGWNDGCESGMAAASNSFYKMFYKQNKIDGYKMANSSEYRTAWNYAWWYCMRRDWVKQKSTIWGSVFMGHVK